MWTSHIFLTSLGRNGVIVWNSHLFWLAHCINLFHGCQFPPHVCFMTGETGKNGQHFSFSPPHAYFYTNKKDLQQNKWESLEYSSTDCFSNRQKSSLSCCVVLKVSSVEFPLQQTQQSTDWGLFRQDGL